MIRSRDALNRHGKQHTSGWIRRAWTVGTDWPRFLRALGLCGVYMPQRYGRTADGVLRRVVAIEELARRDSAAGATLSAASLGTGLILSGGNDEQRCRGLPEVAASRDIMTICMTECGSGSHLLGMSTTARRVAGGWVLDGRKCFIGNSHIATAHGVIARTSSGRHRSVLSAFVVDAVAEGCRVGDEHDFGARRPPVPISARTTIWGSPSRSFRRVNQLLPPRSSSLTPWAPRDAMRASGSWICWRIR